MDGLPAVDMLVTTADPELEPPLMTVNTVLSLLAMDYPDVDKLACYVSDDGCSPVTCYALHEAARFAGLWVPNATQKMNNKFLRQCAGYHLVKTMIGYQSV